MNLFCVELNIPPSYYYGSLKALNRAPEIFPNLLNGRRYNYGSDNDRNFILMQYSDPNLLGKRQYVAEDENNIVFYSGLPVDPVRQIPAHRAESLLKNFDAIKYTFEGQACLVKFNKHTNDVDLITDNLGMEQIYFYNENGQFIFGNHISLIESAARLYQLDPEGVSYYLSIGWAASNSTLRKDIKLIGGGQHWHWDSKKHNIDKKKYYDPSLVKLDTRAALKKENIRELAETMTNCFSELTENFDIECPLTGGQDSRLVTAFLIKNNINAKYYTSGNPRSEDAVVASLIVDKFNLDHRFYETDEILLNKEWDGFIKKFILQNDGLASLCYLAAILTHFEKQDTIKVRMATHAAKAANIVYNKPDLLLKEINKNIVINCLTEKLINNAGGLIYDFSIKVGEKYIESFVKSNIGKSVPLKMLPDLFFLYERDARFHGNNWGNQRYIADSFDVFACKKYINTAMQIHPLKKITSPLHYSLMRILNRELMKLPFEGYKEFGIQNLRLRLFIDQVKKTIKKNIYSMKQDFAFNKKGLVEVKKSPKNRLNAFNKLSWFIVNLEHIRTAIFDQPYSDLWQYINKPELEKILMDKEGKLIQPKYLERLFNIATLFYYDYFTNQRRKAIEK